MVFRWSPEAMKKALIIVVAVAAYALIEVGVLLSTIATQHSFSPWTYPAAVLWSQFLLIPGLAALLSRIVYGRHGWIRRTVTILLAGSLGVPIAVLSFFISMALLVAVLFWASGVSWILFCLLVPVVAGLVVMGFLFLVRKSGKRTVQAEAERWLAERQSGVTEADRAWRSRSIRIAACIPLMTVLPIFLFLPETWGLLSHLDQPQSGHLSGYRVTTPAAWIVLSHDDQQSDGRSWANGIAGRGIGFCVIPLRYDSFSSWSVGTDPFNPSEATNYDPKPKDAEIISRGHLTIGSESMNCIDYWPSYDWGPPRSEAVTIAHVTCSDTGRLRARFDGDRSQLPTFYRMLSTIKPVR
jgi:hypothetical protein